MKIQSGGVTEEDAIFAYPSGSATKKGNMEVQIRLTKKIKPKI